MYVGYVSTSSAYTADYRVTTTTEDFKFKPAITEDDIAALESDKEFYSQMSGSSAIESIFFTEYTNDKIDAIVVLKDGRTCLCEYKRLYASSTDTRYRESQLYETTKKDYQLELANKLDAIPIFIRYFVKDHKKIVFNINKIDWTDQTHIEKFKCSKSKKERDVKVLKDVWFLNNKDSIKRDFVTYEN